MSKIIIRPLSSADEAEACARLMNGSEPWLTLGRGYRENLALVTNVARERFVAHEDGRLAGFIILNLQGAFVGYIQAVCVSPEFRNRGIGSTLVRFAEERIFAQHPNVFLCVSSFNVEARKLYERLGYVVVGELKDYVVVGHSELLLRKTRGPLDSYRPPSAPASGA